MVLEYFLYTGLLLGWALNLYFFCRFAVERHKSEPEPARAWGALAAVCLPALAFTFFLAARGGCGSDQDFLYLGSKFFRADLKGIFELKEITPLLTDRVTDALSGYSLRAILWKNRLLFSASAFLFFTGLRRLGAGLAVSFLASAFLFWNFLSPLNANTFSTTAPNLFIWLLALTAVFDAHMSAEISARHLAWIFSTVLLTAGTRPEFLPVNLALLAASAAARPGAWKKCLSAAPARWLLPAAACFAAAWTIHFHGLPGGADGPAARVFPLKTLFYQLGTRNFLVLAGAPPGWALDAMAPGQALRPLSPLAGLLCAGFAVFAAFGAYAGWRAAGPGRARVAWLFALLLGWAAYFSFIYPPLDAYPLQFMRHQLYFFLPFAYLFALAATGLLALAGRQQGRRRKQAALAGVLLLAGYAWLNASAALRLNTERRANDLELEFLSAAQRAWVPGCKIYYPDEQQYRAAVLKKYFAFTGLCDNCAEACRPSAENCVLEYLPPEGVSPVPALARMDEKAVLRVKAACPGASRPGPAKRAAAAAVKKTTGYGEAYDPLRDISADIRSAAAEAGPSGRRVLVLVGGDWCSWCGTMGKFFDANPDLKAFLRDNFVKVKAYYNPSDMPPPKAFANYPSIPGYPHIYVLNADGTVFESRDTTSLENDAGGYDREKFSAFLKKAAPPSKP